MQQDQRDLSNEGWNKLVTGRYRLAPLDWPIPALLAGWSVPCAWGFLCLIVKNKRRVIVIINQKRRHHAKELLVCSKAS